MLIILQSSERTDPRKSALTLEPEIPCKCPGNLLKKLKTSPKPFPKRLNNKLTAGANKLLFSRYGLKNRPIRLIVTGK